MTGQIGSRRPKALNLVDVCDWAPASSLFFEAVQKSSSR